MKMKMEKLWLWLAEKLFKHDCVRVKYEEMFTKQLKLDYETKIDTVYREANAKLFAEQIKATKKVKELEDIIADIKNINIEKTAEQGKIVKKRKYNKRNGKKGNASEQTKNN